MRMQRRYHRMRQAARPVPACHDQRFSVVGPRDAIRRLNQMIEELASPAQETGISGLRIMPTEAPPPVHAYVNGKWRPTASESPTQIDLSLQVYTFDPGITESDAAVAWKEFLERRDPELLSHLTVCIDPVVDNPFEVDDAPFEVDDAPFEVDDAPFEVDDAPFEVDDAPFEVDDAPTAVDPEIASNTVARQPALERTGFNWLRQGRPDLTGRDVTVLILDTLPAQSGIDVPNEYVDFWVDWVGDAPLPAAPSGERPSPPVIPAAEIHRYHGVFVASLIRHLAPASTIVAARVLDDQGSGWSTTLIQAMLWALGHRKNKTMINGRRLIHDKLIFNMSMGLPRTQAEEAEAVCLLRTLDAAVRTGTLAVAASGNDSWRKPENPVEPAAYGFFADTRATAAQIIAAAGTNRLTEYAFFSNEGHIAAPCRHIIGDTGPDSQIQQKYGYSTVRWSGTSFATPQVSGLAALLWSTGRIPFHGIKQHIWRTAHIPRRWDGVREIDFVRAFRAI
jgi:subtilisin family serine protease